MSEFAVVGLLERGRAASWPGVSNPASGFGVGDGEESWRLSVPGMSPAAQRELSFLLDEREKREQRARDDEERLARRDAGPDEALAGQARIEAAAERAEWIAGRPERVEQRLDSILSELRAIASALEKR